MTVRRTFWILSIANWLLAVAVWSVSAYLGIARPTSLFIPTTLFVIGIFAVIAGTLCWVVARFGQPPEPAAATEAAVTEAAVTAAEAIPATPATAAATRAEAPVTEPARGTAMAAESPAVGPSGDAAPGERGSAAEQPLPAEAG
jgi:hypothetical protein